VTSKDGPSRWDADKETIGLIGDQFALAVEAFMDLELLIAADELQEDEFADRFNDTLALGTAAKVAMKQVLDTWPIPSSELFINHSEFYSSTPSCLTRIEKAFDLFHLAMRLTVSEKTTLGSERFEIIELAREIAFRVLNSNLQAMRDVSATALVNPESLNEAVSALQQDYEQNLTPMFDQVKEGFS
jgi:hypothetical protein